MEGWREDEARDYVVKALKKANQDDETDLDRIRETLVVLHEKVACLIQAPLRRARSRQ